MSAAKLFCALVIVTMTSRRCASLEIPHGVSYVGIGYDIIEGNPEGDELASGGVDPGLKVSRRVFKLTYDTGRTSGDGVYSIPDETTYVHRSSSFTTSKVTSFQGTKSYQKKLSTAVEVSGGFSSLFASVQFAASTRYASVDTGTSVNHYVYSSKETVENFGRIRYRDELASHDDYELERGFVAAACTLPNAYDQDSYMRFIQDWGTHIVTEVDLGSRSGSRYKEQMSSFVEYASTQVGVSVSASGEYKGYSASLTVDMDSFNSAQTSERQYGSQASEYHVGSPDLNEPISLTLMTMNEVFNSDFWSSPIYVNEGLCSSAWSWTSVSANVQTALGGYAEWLKISSSSDSAVVIPVTWPDGTYGLPKPQTGCPNSHFTWAEGARHHDTEDHNSNNYWTTDHHLAGTRHSNDMEQEFCMKTTPVVDTTYSRKWPAGSYCIFKRGDCPEDFDEGYIKWDDEDDSNKNTVRGTLPEGTYTRDTVISFCCREDGVVDVPIHLPTADNFYLFARFENCQLVNGMKVINEYYRWDNEDDNNKDAEVGACPYQGLEPDGHDVVIHFCYYYR